MLFSCLKDALADANTFCGILESFRLENTPKVIESNLWASLYQLKHSTECHFVISLRLPGMETPTLPLGNLIQFLSIHSVKQFS